MAAKAYLNKGHAAKGHTQGSAANPPNQDALNITRLAPPPNPPERSSSLVMRKEEKVREAPSEPWGCAL